MRIGTIAPAGEVALRVIPRNPPARFSILAAVRHAIPWFGLGRDVNLWRLRNVPNIMRGLWRVTVARAFRIPTHFGVLYLTATRDGRTVNLGLASLRVVTDVGVAHIVDAFQNSVEIENMKYHGFGTGTGNEAAGDTALGTELTTQYATDSTRPTGTTTEGATGNIYRTVATLSPDSGGTIAVTEHGVFSANASGVLLDRSKFSAVNLVAGSDSLQATYELTFTSGS